MADKEASEPVDPRFTAFVLGYTLGLGNPFAGQRLTGEQLRLRLEEAFQKIGLGAPDG